MIDSVIGSLSPLPMVQLLALTKRESFFLLVNLITQFDINKRSTSSTIICSEVTTSFIYIQHLQFSKIHIDFIDEVQNLHGKEPGFTDEYAVSK